MSTKFTIADRLAARTPKAALTKAHELELSKQYVRSFKLFVVAAEAGLTEAQREVGLHYLTGRGVIRNKVEAARWLNLAAEKGDVAAQRSLASLYMFGLSEDALREANVSLFDSNQGPRHDHKAALRWGKLAAASGDAEAQGLLGFLLATGPEGIRNLDEAKFWYAKAAEAGSPQGHLGIGVLTLDTADTDEATFAAVNHIREAASAGLGHAHYYMAVIYERAIGVHADLALAAQHYGLAAKAGVRNAQAKYGHMLLNGIGITANAVEAESWLRRAGLAGDKEAATLVANIYARGDGKLPPNYAEAAAWYRIAAEAGNPQAARALGVLYLSGAGVARDPDEAAMWLRRSAEAGSQRAKADLGSILLKGQLDPIRTEPPPVHQWFEEAAERGDPIGACNYAICLAHGIGTQVDEQRAAAWFRRAADTIANAQYWYGCMLAEGRGVTQDFTGAREWLQKAAAAQLPEAMVALGELHLKGLGGPIDHDAARLCFERAAKLGHQGAMFALGAMYGGGHRIATDRQRSLEFYRQAAELGHPMASLMLGKYLRYGIATMPDLDAAKKWLKIALARGISEAEGELLAIEPATAED